MNKYRGTILKGIGGFYYVKTEAGVIECRARGLFRNKSMTPFVGDKVEIEISDDGSGYVTSIDERKNCFIRPPIANIDLLLVVIALASPAPDLMFLDKVLIQAQNAGVECYICFNKSDLTDGDNPYEDIYKSLGYKTCTVSTYDGTGLDELKSTIRGKLISVCGFSGVGKSSLLNAILSSDDLGVGEVSRKLSRGKHTTREVSLIEYTDGSYLADTPGFSSLALPENITKDNLKDFFIEFSKLSDGCKFSDCIHINSKYCSVISAVQNGEIAETRYNNYVKLYESIKDKKEWKK